MLYLSTLVYSARSFDKTRLSTPKPIQFKDSINNEFRGDFQSSINSIKVDVKVKFPNMKMKNVNLDSASWIANAECTKDSVDILLEDSAPSDWPEKAFVFIGQYWCVDTVQGPWFVASNIQLNGNKLFMNIVPGRPEDHADYFELTAKLVKKESSRKTKRNLDKDFEWVQLPYCFDEQSHGTCQKDLVLHQDYQNSIICEDCWAYLNFGFLYKATGRLRKFFRGLNSTINMAAKGEMNFDFRVESRSTIERGFEKYFDATKLISKIIPIIDIPDVLQLHPEASLWAGAHLKVTRNVNMKMGMEGDVDFESTSGPNAVKRFKANIIPHPSSVEVLENKGLADVTLTADVSLVFVLLNGVLQDRAGTYFDATTGIYVNGLSEKCPNQYEYTLMKGYEMGLHVHGNRKTLIKQELEAINCPKCNGCATIQ